MRRSTDDECSTLLRAVRAAVWALLAVTLAACGGRSVADERDARLREAAAGVAAELDDAIARTRAALADVPQAIERAGAEALPRFDALEKVRATHRVDGLTWTDPGGAPVWAGTPVLTRDPTDLPPPWTGTFRTRDFVWHAGPFRRAVVLEATPTTGGAAASTFLGGSGGAADPLAESLEDAWARRYRVGSVRVVPPEVLQTPPPDGLLRVPAGSPPGGEPLAAVEVVSRTDAVLAADILAEARRTRGWVGLAGLALATFAAWAAVRRWAPGPFARGLGVAALAILVRQGLRVLDLAGRFEDWGAAFRASDYAVPGHFGWLSSPMDLLLTATAALVAAVGIGRGVIHARMPVRPAGRVVTAAAGVALAAVAVRAWLFLVEGAPANGDVEVFGPGSLWPSLPRGILLSALLLATAAGWTLVRTGLRMVVAAAPAGRGRLATYAAAVAAGLAASWMGAPTLTAWGPFALPAAAALLGRLAAGDPRPGAPTRMLLVSVFSFAVLFPVLWVAAADDDRSDLVAEMSDLVRGQEMTATQMPIRLGPLAGDPALVRALERYTVSGGSYEGLALHAWRRLHLNLAQGVKGAVVVHDGAGRRIDRFAVEAPPFRRLPEPRPATDPDAPEIVVQTVPGRGNVLDAVVGTIRIVSPEGPTVGFVSVVVPDPLAIRLAGFLPRLATARRADEEPSGLAARPLEIAVIRDGRVVQGTDPTLPRQGPPPAVLPDDGAPGWRPDRAGGGPWLVVPAGARGAVIARVPAMAFEEGLVAAARMAVVGVGIGTLLALVALLVGLRQFRVRLRDKILWSFVGVSIVPLVALGVTNWRDSLSRAAEDFQVRQVAIVNDARRELEGLTGGDLDVLQKSASEFAALREQDLNVYVRGTCTTSTVQSLVDAEVLPSRLDASVYRGTEIEGRDLVVRDEIVAGSRVRILYAPLHDANGRIAATLAAPLVYDSERAERLAARSGSVLVAAYLLALVLIVTVGLWTARGLTHPIERLAQATRRVAAGELDVAIGGAGGGEIGALVADFDRMTADLRRARDRAAAAEREAAWRGMARQVAHEIKNPLTPMKLMLQQLLATARSDPRTAAEMIEPTAKVVLDQIAALSRIASDFAAFARFPPRALTEVDVNDVLRGVALLYSGGESSEVRVETDLAPDVPPVRWDADEVRRVFVNLVANALEARDPSREVVRVAIRSRRSQVPGSGREGVLVTVADDGVGIPPEHQERLFQPNFSTKTHGTGLGLAIVRRILTDLGGEIRIDSEPGRGTTVSTWLPAAPPEASLTVG